MAFKMNPTSPLLMKAMGIASPAKNMNKGDGPMETSSPAKQTKQGTNQTITADSESQDVEVPLTELQKAEAAASEARLNKKISNIRRNTSTVQKETARDRKRTARNNSATERKTKNAAKTQARVEKRKEDGKTRVGKVIAKVKNALVSPTKQTAKQKANLPKEIVNAIAAKSPAKQSRRTTRLQNKEAKETNKIIRGEKTSARKVNRLNNRIEVSKAKDKVKAVRKNQRAEKLKNKANVLNNKAQG